MPPPPPTVQVPVTLWPGNRSSLFPAAAAFEVPPGYPAAGGDEAGQPPAGVPPILSASGKLEEVPIGKAYFLKKLDGRRGLSFA